MNQRQSRNKRGSFIINLIETPSGYSMVQGIDLLNRSESLPAPLLPLQHCQNLMQSQQTIPVQKDPKLTFKRVNLVFQCKPFTATTSHEGVTDLKQTFQSHSSFAEWFDLGSVHESEEKEVSQWFSEGVKYDSKLDPQQMLLNYKEHRNFIVHLYKTQYANDQKYLSANALRSYISADAFWLSKIHLFLTKHGIINSCSKFAFQGSTHAHTFKKQNDQKQTLIPYELDISLKDKMEEGENGLLKKLTSEIRPYCDFCRVHCGIVWFQHNRSLDPKEILNIMKNVNSKNPPLSQKEYEYILCVKCYCENHFPLLLTNHDFKKVSVNDRLEPNRKKKNRRRHKEKRKRTDEEGPEDIDDKPEEENSHHQEEEDEEKIEKKEQVKALIRQLVSQVNDKKWTLPEISFLLELVEKHGQDWEKIHQLMKKHGYCRDIDTEDIIFFFLTLPRRGISRLQQEYSDEELIENNFSYHNHTTGGRVEEKKLADAINFCKVTSDSEKKMFKEKIGMADYQWKANLSYLVKLKSQKLQERIGHLEECENMMKRLSK